MTSFSAVFSHQKESLLTKISKNDQKEMFLFEELDEGSFCCPYRYEDLLNIRLLKVCDLTISNTLKEFIFRSQMDKLKSLLCKRFKTKNNVK